MILKWIESYRLIFMFMSAACLSTLAAFTEAHKPENLPESVQMEAGKADALVLNSADLDGDRGLESIVGLSFTDKEIERSKLYVLSAAGVVIDGLPLWLPGVLTGSPLVVDLDDDGDSEMVVVTTQVIVVLHHDGAIYTNDCSALTGRRLPMLMACNDDVAGNQIVVQGSQSNLVVFDGSDQSLTCWPSLSPGVFMVPSARRPRPMQAAGKSIGFIPSLFEEGVLAVDSAREKPQLNPNR